MQQDTIENLMTQPSTLATEEDQLIATTEIRDEKTELSKHMVYRLPLIGPYAALCETYDPKLLTMLGVQYLIQGAGTMMSLAQQDLFKSYFELEPSDV